MKRIAYPKRDSWALLCNRPALPSEDLSQQVATIMAEVRLGGDSALRELTKKHDRATIASLLVGQREIDEACSRISAELKAAVDQAAANIRKFHQAQQHKETTVETMPGVTCWRRRVPIEVVGLYIPGGSAPLFSTVLMLAIPALISGCKRIVLCTPPNEEGRIAPAILYTASILGLTEVFKVGGAQAIAAMAYGTETIPRVNKIFGPGNQYVTMAKEMVLRNGTAIDMPAGPSELLIIADEYADPDFVASDLLSQAEHGADSQVVLLTTSGELERQVQLAVEEQLQLLPRSEIAARALENSLSIVLPSIAECVELSNMYAPEHLILALENAALYEGQITNAGSVFMGNYSCESAGDYASGTNHTLPTNGNARSYSGVSLESFSKTISYQRITPEGLKRIGRTIEVMAEAEQMIAHRNAVSIRLKKINDGK